MAKKAYPKPEWTYKILNPLNIPKEYWVLDLEAIRKAIDEGKRFIPGLKIFEKGE